MNEEESAMRLAVLGTGKIVREVLPVLEKLGIRPHAILGTQRHRERALELAGRFQIPYCCFQYDELLLSGADTVYVALPNDLHYPYAKQALLSGKHVIVEKPIATTLSQLRELRRLAEERGLVLAEAMTVHHLPAFQAIRRTLGSLGKLRLACFQFGQYSSRYDAFLRGEIAPAFDPARAGGALMDLNVYNIHCAAALFGRPRDVRYCANIQRGIDTSGVLTLDYGDMKAVCIAAKDCQGANISSIQGEEGRIECWPSVSQLSGYERILHSGGVEWKDGLCLEHRMHYEFAAFERIIDGGRLAEAGALLDISEIATEILETAWKQAELGVMNLIS